MGCEVDLVKTYTVHEDKEARFRNKSFINVVNNEIKNRSYDALLLHGGCNEASNLNMDLAKVKSLNLAARCTKLLKMPLPTIQDSVIICNRITRYENEMADPGKHKSNLSIYGNSVYQSLWMADNCPSNIKIVDLGLGPPESVSAWQQC